jgi:hypothetical protein
VVRRAVGRGGGIKHKKQRAETVAGDEPHDAVRFHIGIGDLQGEQLPEADAKGPGVGLLGDVFVANHLW